MQKKQVELRGVQGKILKKDWVDQLSQNPIFFLGEETNFNFLTSVILGIK